MSEDLKTRMRKLNEDSESIRLALPKVPSSKLSKQIDKFVNACRNIRKDIAGAYEEYQITLQIARDEDFGEYATNLLIRSRLAPVGDAKTISSMMRALGVKSQFLTKIEDRHPRQSKDAEDQDEDDNDEDEDDYNSDDEDEDEDDENEDDEETAYYPTRVILELHSDIFKKIFLVYTKNKENDNDQLIKLVAEVRCSSNDVKLLGGSILSVKK